jgi:oligopeptide/dipeptide ABC transporter ATP-binding protein
MEMNSISDNNKEALLKIDHLKTWFKIPGKGDLHAVDDISLEIMPNETLGLVGESGCGKSTVGNVIMRLIPATSGHIYFEGGDMASAKGKSKAAYAKKTQMIFQDPYSSLNPRKSIRSILSDPFKIYKIASRKEPDDLVEKLAQKVGLELYVLDQFPHELDGGKRQMVGIARALSMNPKFIVCDEPVSALDVSVQATIINLLIDMQREMGFSYLFISHDLSVVRHISNRVAIMYLGQIVEIAPTDEVFSNTLHPYSIALLSAVPEPQEPSFRRGRSPIRGEGSSLPDLNFDHASKRIVLAGDVPSPLNPKPGCRFAPRCWMAHKECKTTDQVLTEIAPGHQVACKFWNESHAHAMRMALSPKK